MIIDGLLFYRWFELEDWIDRYMQPPLAVEILLIEKCCLVEIILIEFLTKGYRGVG